MSDVKITAGAAVEDDAARRFVDAWHRAEQHSPDEQEWKINWIADQLAWSGRPIRVGQSRLYKFPDGKLVYFENRNLGNGAHHYWVRITESNCERIMNGSGSRHIIFIDQSTRAIILSQDPLQQLREAVREGGRGKLDLAIYPDNGFRVQGKNYQANWALFVVDVGLICDYDRHRLAITSFPASDAAPMGQALVGFRLQQVKRFQRSVPVSAWVWSYAQGRCAACNRDAPFLDEDGVPFLEVHHLKPLAEGGPDTPDNAIAVCPNCHRELHYGQNAIALRRKLVRSITRLKAY